MPPRDLSARLIAPLRQVHRAVLPIYERDGRNNPRGIGTGVIIGISSTPVLVTAAHVQEQAKRLPLLIPVGDGLSSLSSNFQETVPPDGKRENDRYDIAVFSLTPEQQHQFHPDVPINAGAISIAERPNYAVGQKTKYVVTGYPTSQQPRQLKGNVLDAHILSPIVLALPESEYYQYSIRPETHLLLEFDRAAFDLEYDGKLIPKPHGMSGGGVWRIDDVSNDGVPRLTLVGIAIEYHKPPRNALVVTRIAAALEGLGRLLQHKTNSPA